MTNWLPRTDNPLSLLSAPRIGRGALSPSAPMRIRASALHDLVCRVEVKNGRSAPVRTSLVTSRPVGSRLTAADDQSAQANRLHRAT